MKSEAPSLDFVIIPESERISGKPGFDYSNYHPFRKNIFLFRDINHESYTVQKDLGKKIKESYLKCFFNTVFVEGENFNSGLNKGLKKHFGLEDLSHLNVLGVEDEKLYSLVSDLSEENLERLSDLIKLEATSEVSYDEVFEKIYANQKKIDSLSIMREEIAFKNVLSHMKNYNLKSAALIFGEGHTDGLIQKFRENNFGWVSYISK